MTINGNLTVRVACETAGAEGIVREWYRDSMGVGTWGIGVTDRSGHRVERYKDKPASIEHVLTIYLWLLRTNYVPAVMAAFKGYALTEAQLAAALSFHYNTGAICGTSWVRLLLAGRTAEARTFLESHYLNDGQLAERRRDEAALFFDGRWKHLDGIVNVYPVRKPSYLPDIGRPQRIDIRADMALALAAQ
jgi:GH24 family phage-related lysozyme (muramidase)